MYYLFKQFLLRPNEKRGEEKKKINKKEGKRRGFGRIHHLPHL